MATYFKSNRFALFIQIVTFLAVACNNKADEKATEKKDTTDTTSTSQTTQPKPAFTGVTLDVLYTDTASFNSLPNGRRIFFAVTHIKPDTITLSGWPTRGAAGNSFDDDPIIVLKKGSSIVIPVDTAYVGNVKLDPNDVQQVKADIKTTNVAFVLFTPSLSTKYPNHIQYSISHSNDDPGHNKNPAIVPTAGTVVANPSPPKQL